MRLPASRCRVRGSPEEHGASGAGTGGASGAGEVTSVPTLEGDNWENGQWVLKWDPQESAELFESLGARTPQAATD